LPLSLFDETLALAAALDAACLPYAAVGGVALAVHGVPRATTDIDLLLRPEHLAAALDVASACGFCFSALPMRFSDGMEVRRVTKIEGSETLTLDLILVSGSLEPVWATRERIGEIHVVSREGLIQMKAWAGRPRDIDDIRRLQEIDR